MDHPQNTTSPARLENMVTWAPPLCAIDFFPFIANFVLILLSRQSHSSGPKLGCYDVPAFSTLFQPL